MSSTLSSGKLKDAESTYSLFSGTEKKNQSDKTFSQRSSESESSSCEEEEVVSSSFSSKSKDLAVVGFGVGCCAFGWCIGAHPCLIVFLFFLGVICAGIFLAKDNENVSDFLRGTWRNVQELKGEKKSVTIFSARDDSGEESGSSSEKEEQLEGGVSKENTRPVVLGNFSQKPLHSVKEEEDDE